MPVPMACLRPTDDGDSGTAIMGKHKLKFLGNVGKSQAKVSNKLKKLPVGDFAAMVAGDLAMKVRRNCSHQILVCLPL
jgi:hypothetical protein